MPTISGRTVLATGATVQNVLLGSQYELAPFDATIEIGLMSTQTLCTCAIFAGPDVLAEPGSFVPIAATVGTEQAPVYPDNYHWEDTVAHGDRLKITLTNGNAASATLNWAIRITPA